MRLAVKVPKQRAEEARRHVIKLNLYDYSRRVVRDGDYVLIPVLGKPGPEYEVVEADLPPATMKKLPELRSSYDILGSVAVINDLNMSYGEGCCGSRRDYGQTQGCEDGFAEKG
jgi:tRNA G37 N-methylase Trm5